MSSAPIAPYCTSANYARRAARAAASIAASVTFAMHRRVPNGCQLLDISGRDLKEACLSPIAAARVTSDASSWMQACSSPCEDRHEHNH